ncbi:hypothetical protein ACFLXP_03645 [Chloroflexota bacterium]
MQQRKLTDNNSQDLKIRMVKHILAHNGRKNADVRTILAETKVGVWNQTNLPDKLKTLFRTR